LLYFTYPPKKKTFPVFQKAQVAIRSIIIYLKALSETMCSLSPTLESWIKVIMDAFREK
jgi:hypothetical protein